MKDLTKDQVIKKYENLSYKEKASILYDALDYMQSYNGRSKLECIILAMGYESYEDPIEDEDGQFFTYGIKYRRSESK